MADYETDNFGMMGEEERAFWKKIGNEIASTRKAIGSVVVGYDRRRRKVTQSVLAEFLGISRASVANIEVGRQRINVYVFTQIMKFLKEYK